MGNMGIMGAMFRVLLHATRLHLNDVPTHGVSCLGHWMFRVGYWIFSS